MSAPGVPEAHSHDGPKLLDRAREIFTRYTVQASEHAYVALALYSAYTHAAEVFDFAPRLLLTSAEKRSGKSRTLEIIAKVGRDPLIAANATVAAIFRSIDPDRPRTLIFDEADTIFGTRIKAELNEDLRGLINAGFQKGTPVLRTVGPTHVPTEFGTFAPVVMAAIGTLPDTITDRAVNIRLRRRKPSEAVSQLRARHYPEMLALGDDFADWISQHADDLRRAEPDTPLEDRAADLWDPLLAVADLAGGQWPALARAAAVALTAEAAEADDEASLSLELLSDTRQVLEHHKSDFVPSTMLQTLLTGMEDSRWSEEGLTGRRIADLLKPYGIRPTRARSGNGRGYEVAKFTDAFERYLSTNPTEVTEVTETAGSRGSESVTLKNLSLRSDRRPQSDSGLSVETTPFLSHLSLSDTSQAEGEGPRCPGGEILNPTYVKLGRTACPMHADLLEEQPQLEDQRQ